jgi:F0F1-type ATP synthase membrane subunit c/vacuolar-type H+-ATPase subunit K
MMGMDNTVTNARLVVLVFAPAQWLLVWSVGYLERLPVRKSLKGAVAGLIGATAMLGSWIIQGKIYSSMTGIDVPTSDNYFFAVIMGESLVSLCVGFLVAFKLRRKVSVRT